MKDEMFRIMWQRLRTYLISEQKRNADIAAEHRKFEHVYTRAIKLTDMCHWALGLMDSAMLDVIAEKIDQSIPPQGVNLSKNEVN